MRMRWAVVAVALAWSGCGDEADTPFTVGDVTAAPIELEPVGDDTVGIQVAGSFTVTGITVPFAADFLLARSDRTAALVSALGIGGESPLDGAELLPFLLDEATG